MFPQSPGRISKRLLGKCKAVGHRIMEDQTDEAQVKRRQFDAYDKQLNKSIARERIKKSTNVPNKNDVGTKLLDASKSARSRAKVVTLWTCVRVFPQVLGCHSTPNWSFQIVSL